MARTVTASAPIYSRTALEAGAVCAGGHPLEAEAGALMLARGGNAVDALVAAAFVGFVVEPASCGVGGYGHTTVWLAKDKRFVSFDHYARAPKAAHSDMFDIDDRAPLHYYGHPITKGRKAELGFLAVAVPGAVRGLCDAHAMFGRLALARVLEPAIGAAETGVPFAWQHVLMIADREADIRRFPDTAAALLPGGQVPRIPYWAPGGDRLDTRPLARTLKAIAAKGAAGFHGGRVARAIADYVAKNGGILAADDIAGYRTRILAEQPTRYRGHDVVACYDQVAYQALNILDAYDLARHGPDGYGYRHLAAEALALAFTDSIVHYGDPDFERAPVDGLASRGFADARRRLIRLNRVVPRPVAAGDPWPVGARGPRPGTIETRPTLGRPAGTSQMVAADSQGNIAATVVSITNGFGALVYVPEVGVFLNNTMQSFDPRPDHPNRIRPGKMPIFAAPALVAARRGRGVFAGAGSGGYRIQTGVLHTFMNVVDHGMTVQAALDHPRVHCQGDETYVDARIPDAVQARLARAGHRLAVVEEGPGSLNFGRIVALARTRRGWSVGGYPAWGTATAGV
ncbi:MAG: gamma-glutamyltransferase family protein [Alphaproteobacteria bacterium]